MTPLLTLAFLCGVSRLAYGEANGVLVEIGKIGSKTFYEVNQVQKMIWTEAKDLCSEHNVNFGKTENEAEFNFLYEKRPRKDFWIAAAQRGIFDQSGDIAFEPLESFAFSNSVLVNEGINFIQRSQQGLCLYASGDHHTYVDSCLVEKHNVLCEKYSS